MVTGSLSPQPGPRPPLDMYMTSILLQIPARNSIIADESVSCGELPKARPGVTPDLDQSPRARMRILWFPLNPPFPSSIAHFTTRIERWISDAFCTGRVFGLCWFIYTDISTSKFYQQMGPLGSHAVTALSEGCPVNFHHRNMTCRVWQEAGN